MNIGPVADYRSIYVASCGQQFASSVLGRDHERECRRCFQVEHQQESLSGVVEAADCVVATAFGNIHGLTEAEQLQALRAAAESLQVELKAWRDNSSRR